MIIGGKVGDRVVIREWDDNPDFWDDSGIMFSLRGKEGTISKIIVNKNAQTFYRLKEWPDWSWRGIDLIPAGHPNYFNDPNYLFKKSRLSCY